ncbi:MAG: hypothetical protein U9Q92_02585 [archaeon]|nr:hypothetical protein [archaeon]
MKKHRKALGISIAIALMFVIFFAAFILIVRVILTVQAVETLKFSEESTAVNTHLYVLLNNNDCTPNTMLPFKIVLGTELSKTPIPGPEEDITINYNNQQDDLKIKDCIEDYMRRLQISEYRFYIEYDGVENMLLDTIKKEEDIITQWEYIAVPESNIAKAVLKIKIDHVVITGKTACPNEDNYRCVPQMACSLFGGICSNKYVCSATKCCCKYLPV